MLKQAFGGFASNAKIYKNSHQGALMPCLQRLSGIPDNLGYPEFYDRKHAGWAVSIQLFGVFLCLFMITIFSGYPRLSPALLYNMLYTNNRGLFSEQTTAKVASNTVILDASYIELPIKK